VLPTRSSTEKARRRLRVALIFTFFLLLAGVLAFIAVLDASLADENPSLQLDKSPSVAFQETLQSYIDWLLGICQKARDILH